MEYKQDERGMAAPIIIGVTVLVLVVAGIAY